MSDQEADVGPDNDVVSMEKLHAKQQRESKELRAKVQQLKHSVSKGDKKRKKEVQQEIAQLESDLQNRHEKEVAECQSILESITVKDKMEPKTSESETKPADHSRLSKAAKRRAKKQLVEKERLEEQERQLANCVDHRRLREDDSLKEALASSGLKFDWVPSDGDCLYASIRNQLILLRGQKFSVEDLRQATRDCIRSNADEFRPFIGEDFNDYCEKVLRPGTWGGDLELNALAKQLKTPILVYQYNEGRGVEQLLVGEEFQSQSDVPALRLTYHKHAISSGEHYNSVVPI